MPIKTVTTNVPKVTDENSEYHKLSSKIHVKIAPDTFIHTVANHPEITGIHSGFSLVANYDLYTINDYVNNNIGRELFEAAMINKIELPRVYLHDILPGCAIFTNPDSRYREYNRACMWALTALYNPNVYKNIPFALNSLLEALVKHRETLVECMIIYQTKPKSIDDCMIYYALESVVTRGRLPSLEEHRIFRKEFAKDFDGLEYYWDFCRTRFNPGLSQPRFRTAIQKALIDIREGHLMTREVIP